MDSNHSVMPSQTPVRRLMKTSDRRDLADWVLMEGIVAEAWRQKNKRPPKSGRAVDRFSPSPASCGYLAGVSVVTTPEGPAFSALAFLVAMVLSTQSSADFRSALRASGLSHSRSARSRYIRFRYAMASS